MVQDFEVRPGAINTESNRQVINNFYSRNIMGSHSIENVRSFEVSFRKVAKFYVWNFLINNLFTYP